MTRRRMDQWSRMVTDAEIDSLCAWIELVGRPVTWRELFQLMKDDHPSRDHSGLGIGLDDVLCAAEHAGRVRRSPRAAPTRWQVNYGKN